MLKQMEDSNDTVCQCESIDFDRTVNFAHKPHDRKQIVPFNR